MYITLSISTRRCNETQSPTVEYFHLADSPFRDNGYGGQRLWLNPSSYASPPQFSVTQAKRCRTWNCLRSDSNRNFRARKGWNKGAYPMQNCYGYSRLFETMFHEKFNSTIKNSHFKREKLRPSNLLHACSQNETNVLCISKMTFF